VEEIRAYIESGVLELYVLGNMSTEEKLQVEAMAQKHPAIQAELSEIEVALEMYADAQSVEPSEQLRNRVLNSLLTNLGDDRNLRTIQPKATVAERVVAMHPRATTSIFYKYAFAASLLLLCLSGLAVGVLYNRLQDSQQQLVSLRLNEQKFTRQVSFLNEEIDVFRDPSFRFIQLKGMPKTPSSALTVAWSAKRRKIMVDLSSAKLPAPGKNQQYQLWAIANGKPVDLGVFDKTTADSTDMKLMKPIASAQAFAVTIEPRGGSVNPTTDQMVVLASL
jgi:anti-sigma-K factor RskA